MRKPGCQKLNDREDHPSAIWMSPDGEFSVLRESDGWRLHSMYDKNSEIVRSAGLDRARFRTKRDALHHLALVLGEKS